ncbi:redoxin domain-containing protein, partial [Vibrio parahaemolyticus]|uniref:redoxin domain-containing protein n=1 Tax=Vibrio parahaemolyticus TaxID=670 RepID=UPI002111A00E
EQYDLGKWAVFFYYPADFTIECPTELVDLADNYEELQKRVVEVYSVSTETQFTHKSCHDSSETIVKIQYYMIGDKKVNITYNFVVM